TRSKRFRPEALRLGDRTVYGPIEVALIAGVWLIETYRFVRLRDCDVMRPVRRHNAVNDLRHMTVVAETSARFRRMLGVPHQLCRCRKLLVTLNARCIRFHFFSKLTSRISAVHFVA